MVVESNKDKINPTDVQSAYEEYMTPKNLQEHMLRVGALALIVSENWTGKNIDGLNLGQAGTLHDIAKPIKFDLAKQAQFGMSQEDIDRLEQLQIRLKTQFGEDEHEVAVSICKEIGCSSEVVKLIDELEWSYIPRLTESEDIESLILIYCDMRIGLQGIVTLEERLKDLRNRDAADDYLVKEKNGKKLEGIITKYVTIDLNSITDEDINKRFEYLLNMPLNTKK